MCWRRSNRRRNAVLRHTVLTCLLLSPGCFAADADAGLIVDESGWSHGTELFLEVTLNGVATGRLAHFDQRDGALYVRASTLRELGFILAPGASDPLRLSDLRGARIDYDAQRQRIAIVAPIEMLSLPTSRLNAPQESAPKPTSSTGLVLDYDVYGTAGSGGIASLSAATGVRAFTHGAGVFDTSAISRAYRVPGAGWETDSVRLDSSWQLAFPDSMLRLTIGDHVTDALDWSRATRLGGVSLGTDFGLQPYRITTPLPAFFGSATLPSAVDLYIDGIKQYSGEVAPGPFQLTTIPTINGAGSAQIVMTDALGRASTVDISLYATRQLLQRGLADWSVDLGVVRQNYGLDSFDYGHDPIASGSLRYGLNDRFTVEAHSEATRGLALAGVGGVWLLGSRGGVMSSSIAHSQWHGEGASQYSLGYNWSDSRFAFSLDSTRAQRGYRDAASLYGLPPPRASDRATVSVNSGRAGSFGINYLNQVYPDQPASRYGGLFWSNTYGGFLSLNVGVNQNLDNAHDRSIFASITLTPNRRTMYSASLQRTGDSTSATVQASQPVPGDGGFGWRAAAQASDHGGANGGLAEAGWLGNQGGLNVGVNALGDSRYGYADASGALVLMGGHLFAARRIDDAFAVVSTDGVAGVPIKLENRPIGVTDADGMLLVARLNAYQRNQLGIDPMDLPANMRIDRIAADVTPSDRAGTLVRFAITPMRAAEVTLVDANGAPIALGSSVRMDASESGAVVGFDGAVYLDGLKPAQTLHVTTPTGRCSVQLDYPASITATIAQIGPLVCRQESAT